MKTASISTSNVLTPLDAAIEAALCATHVETTKRGSDHSFTRQTADEWANALLAAVTLDLGPHATSDTTYTDGAPPSAHYARRQIHDFAKKFIPSTCKKNEISEKTWASFREAQCRLAEIRPWVHLRLNIANRYTDRPWGGRGVWGQTGENSPTAINSRILVRARRYVEEVLGVCPPPDVIAAHMTCGPGVNIGVPFVDTSPSRKLQCPMTGTRGGIALFKYLLKFTPELRDAILPESGKPGITFTECPGDKFTDVPKDRDIGRGITPPPVANGLIHQSLGWLMANRLKTWGLDLEYLPEVHQLLALQSSLTGSNSTVDLHRASDNITDLVVMWFFQHLQDWLWYMNGSRAAIVTRNEEQLKLETYAAMGNAFTFPLETLIFASLIASCVQECSEDRRSLLPERKYLEQGSVFGDDCVIPSGEVTSLFLGVLGYLGMEVNQEKTWSHPSVPFRESCGFDAYMGHNIRPYCIKTPDHRGPLAFEAWLYKIGNALFPRYIEYFGGVFLSQSALLRSWVDLFSSVWQGGAKFVPPTYPDDSGLFLIPGLERFLAELGLCAEPRKWCRKTQSYSFPVLTFKTLNDGQARDAVRWWERVKRLKQGDGRPSEIWNLVVRPEFRLVGPNRRLTLVTRVHVDLISPNAEATNTVTKGKTYPFQVCSANGRFGDVDDSKPRTPLESREGIDGVYFVRRRSRSFNNIDGAVLGLNYSTDRRYGRYSKAWVQIEYSSHGLYSSR